MKIQQLQQIEARLDKKQSRIDSLKARIEKDSAEIEKLQGQIDKDNEKIRKELRQEWEVICLDAVIVGAYGMKIAHGMTAPYTHEYFIADQRYHMRGGINPENPLVNKVTGPSIVGTVKNLCSRLVNIGWSNGDFQALKQESDRLWEDLPTGYTPNLYKRPANSWERGHIADGYETDGFDNIVRGRCGGDYSSMTTTSQNDLAAFLPVLKGFCPDHYFLNTNAPGNERFALVKEVYERHGIDADLSDLDEWAKRNPTRCMSDSPYFVSKEDAQRSVSEEAQEEEDLPF